MEVHMDDGARQRYEAKSAQLRAELKQFEADWASRNGGKKPGRLDIKQNPGIASKYKKYNHVRDVLAGKLPATPPKPRKRTSENDLSQTPSKRPKSMQTPSKIRTLDVEDGIFETPSSRTLFSPAMPTSIGPTPQKNGRILGMFDLLEENTENEPPNGDLEGKNHKVQSTPSKRPASAMEEAKLGRTPMSSSKRNMLNTFMTPSKRKDGSEPCARTPSSVSKLHLATPAFLRRAPMPTVDEDGQYLSPPAPLRLPRKPLGRSLSSVVAGLRKLEEEKYDDDMDALREMEDETTPSDVVKPTKSTSKAPPEILESDSQAPQLLGGFDDEALYDSPTEEMKGRDGQPLRVYKKKGQKRTTRRVNIKPTRTKRPHAVVEADVNDHAEGVDDNDDQDEVVPETQFDPNKLKEGPQDIDSDPDFAASGTEDEATEKAQLKKVATTKKEGKVHKVARKVNELAHANFKRLKLRNTGSKGGPGFGSRFRRRK
ncbi:DNA replication/checkpoint protein [Xylaria bambusicola]|uniref:DNA replication/checkpoint protein n=1 Tax=Xylaria bambusicola TaxID=326684 RepID=UPI0020072F33|nr:DNA replication/checkpoint protein [Xylaria bambusicola]KAI0516901.1 DNA replication/checkpoint protein [Xylaria bambusicola]